MYPYTYHFLCFLLSSIAGLPCEITFILPKGKVLNQSVLVANTLSFDLSKNNFIMTSFLKNFCWV